jgi:outer membrane immunogenic protein
VFIYGTAGLAFGSLRAETFGLSESHVSAGWTAGVGAEVGLAQNWTAKIEYLFVDLSDSQFNITGMQNGYQFGLVRVGANYHF